MDYPNCSLVNASPVNNGPPTIYQTTLSGPNGQQTDLFSSGMQYSSEFILISFCLSQVGTRFRISLVK
jgi:hypothetical protein